jgi:hypothetical protein
MFTQRHFEAVAQVISRELDSATSQVGKRQVRNVALGLADLFKTTNPRFNRQKFYVACGLNHEGNPPTTKAPVTK